MLNGPRLSAGRWYAPRQAVLTVSVLNAGGQADIAHVVLESPQDAQLLANGDFAAGLAHWLPAAQGYFVPWHIDNLYAETLIERGLLGLAFLLGIAGAVLSRLLRQADPGDTSTPFIAASLCGLLCLGLMSSVLDMPRVALLFFLLLAMGSNARLRQV